MVCSRSKEMRESPALKVPGMLWPVAPQGTSTERRMDMAMAVLGAICGQGGLGEDGACQARGQRQAR